MKYEIEILSPLHIGDGTRKKVNELYLCANRLYKVDLREFRNNLPDDLKGKLDSIWETEILKKTVSCPNLTDFIDNNNIRNLVTSQPFVQVYNLSIKDFINNKVGLVNFIRTSDSPFIPGSEIKGAIRTAVLYKRLKDDPSILSEIINKLKSIPEIAKLKTALQTYKKAQNKVRSVGVTLARMKRNEKKGTPEYSQKHTEYFNLKKQRNNAQQSWEDCQKTCSDKINKIITDYEQKLFQLVDKDVKTSLFKNLIISDSELINLKHLFITKEKITHKDPDTERKLHNFIKEFLKKDTKSCITMNILTERNKLLFCGDSKGDSLTLDSIIKACKEFALAKITAELNYFNQSTLKKRYEKTIKFYNDLKNRINADTNAIFLRLGAGQGLLSTTIDLLLKGETVFKDLIANLKANRDEYNNPSADYPASRRVVITDSEELPPGWIVLRGNPWS